MLMRALLDPLPKVGGSLRRKNRGVFDARAPSEPSAWIILSQHVVVTDAPHRAGCRAFLNRRIQARLISTGGIGSAQTGSGRNSSRGRTIFHNLRATPAIRRASSGV